MKRAHRLKGDVLSPKVLSLSMIVALLLVACGGHADEPDSAPASSSPSPESTLSTRDYRAIWQLRAGRGPSGKVPLVRGWPITMEITRTGLGGTASCNDYGMRLEISGASFETSHGSINQAGCFPEAELSEERFVAALIAAEIVHRDGRSLTLKGPQTILRFREIPAPAVADMVDIRWRLVKMRSKEESIEPMASPIFRLNADGTFAVRTGCGRYFGEWVVGAGQINIVESSNRQKKCSQPLEDQHNFMLTVAGDSFKAEVTGGRLKLGDLHSFGELTFHRE